jgi:hypothetical protein
MKPQSSAGPGRAGAIASTRRRALLACAAILSGGAAALSRAEPAAAQGTPLLVGVASFAAVTTTLVRNTIPATDSWGFQVNNYSNSGPSIYGTTHNGTGDAIQGRHLGPAPIAGVGVRGHSAAGYGTVGSTESTANVAVGVYGWCPPGTGVFGYATASDAKGVWGDNAGAGWGVFGRALGNGLGVVGEAPSGGWAGWFSGRLRVTGNLQVDGTKSAIVPHPDGSMRLMYATEAPVSMFEDFGRARLVKGMVNVRLDPEFAVLVNADDYDVFLTPYGECRGLAVLDRAPDGFVIRELQAGTSSIDVGYRIVARRADTHEQRFTPVARTQPLASPAAPPPPQPLPSVEELHANGLFLPEAAT